jgi:hypothetical protein
MWETNTRATPMLADATIVRPKVEEQGDHAAINGRAMQSPAMSA